MAAACTGGLDLPLLFLVVLAVVQGITEFLPISSSGHLELAWQAMRNGEVVLPPEGDRLVLFVAVHLGTLFAVLGYFWRDVLALIGGTLRLVTGRGGPAAYLALHIITATLPLVAFGLLLKDILVDLVYSPVIIAWTNIVFAVFLYLSDRLGMTLRRAEHLTIPSALVIGFAQVLSLIPGTSRSGVTMTAARMLGFERLEAARISLLMAIPAILGAAILQGIVIYERGDLSLGIDSAIAAVLAFAVALAAIAAMMAWLRRASFTPFVVYRLLLGALLLWLIHKGVPIGDSPF